MFKPFLCGSFQNQEDQDIIDTFSPCSTPKRSRKSNGSYKNKENKNRYANLGLDKFHALLSEIEEKKQKIYTQKGAEDIAVVQFVISSDNEIKPIVVKMKGKRPSDVSSTITSPKTTSNNLKASSEKLKKDIENQESCTNTKMEVEKIPKKKRGGARWDIFKFERFKQPFYYLPVVVMLILVFLAIYGRPFAILCTSIGWYLIPLLREPSDHNKNQRRLKRKKEHSRRLSEKTFGGKNDGSSSPTSVFNGPAGVSPPRQQHSNRRSW